MLETLDGERSGGRGKADAENPGHVSDWTLKSRYLVMKVSENQVKALVAKWVSLSRRWPPTVHVCGAIKCVVIHLESGTLVRDINMLTMDLHGIMGGFSVRASVRRFRHCSRPCPEDPRS